MKIDNRILVLGYILFAVLVYIVIKMASQ